MPDEIAPVPESTPAAPAPVPEPAAAPAIDPTPVTVPNEAPAADPAVAAAIDELEGELDGKPYKIPANVKLPWKIGEKSGFATVADLQKSPQFEGDYRQKTARLAERERELEVQGREAQEQFVRSKARTEFLEREFKRYAEASAEGGEAWERYQRHLDMYQSDPNYREAWDSAAERHVERAVDAFHTEQTDTAYRQNVASDIRSYITEKVAGTGLDPARIEQLYIHALSRGAELRTSAVDRIIEHERSYVSSVTQPFQDELAKLTQRVNELAAIKETASHNERVDAAIDRANQPRSGVPANGAPPAPSRLKPFDPTTDNSDEWRRTWRQAG